MALIKEYKFKYIKIIGFGAYYLKCKAYSIDIKSLKSLNVYVLSTYNLLLHITNSNYHCPSQQSIMVC